MFKHARTLASLLAGLSLSVAAHAQFYFDESAFLSALAPGYYTENFNSQPNGQTAASLDFSANGFAYTITSSISSDTSSVYTGGAQGLIGPNSVSDGMLISFTGNTVTAVGGFLFNTDQVNALIEDSYVMVSINGGSAYTFNYTDVNSLFAGFISPDNSAITSVYLSGPGVDGVTRQWVSLDNLSVGAARGITPVPEPSTYGLMGAAALAGLGFWRRRRAKA